MGRGLERRRIFNSDTDKQDFLNRLSDSLAETGTECLAWSLMTNHYHLLVWVGDTPLSELMRKLLSGYATDYNRRHRRVGYVFQNRYKSILCDTDSYFLQLVRYIHLNPVKARLIKTVNALEQYPWTGHTALNGGAGLSLVEYSGCSSVFWQTEDESKTRVSGVYLFGIG